MMRSVVKFEEQYFRKISKYDIDRQCVDFDKLKKEKERERTDANKLLKDMMDKETEEKKQIGIE